MNMPALEPDTVTPEGAVDPIGQYLNVELRKREGDTDRKGLEPPGSADEDMYQLASGPLGGVEGDYDNPAVAAFDKSRSSIRNPTYDVANGAGGTGGGEPVYALGQGSADEDEDMYQLASGGGGPVYDNAESEHDNFPDDGYLDIEVTDAAHKTDAVLEAVDGTGTLKRDWQQYKIRRKGSFC